MRRIGESRAQTHLFMLNRNSASNPLRQLKIFYAVIGSAVEGKKIKFPLKRGADLPEVDLLNAAATAMWEIGQFLLRCPYNSKRTIWSHTIPKFGYRRGQGCRSH